MSTVSVWRTPVAELLQSVGMRFKVKEGGGWKYYNLIGECPVCKHKVRGDACGVGELEKIGAEGTELEHDVKCMHLNADAELGKKPYKAFLERLHVNTASTFDPSRMTPARRRKPSTAPTAAPSAPAAAVVADPPPPVDPARVREQMARLRKHKEAMAYLTARGLTEATIERFQLGLRRGTKGSPAIDPLDFPVMTEAFTPIGHYYRYHVPGVTRGMPEPCKGAFPASTYYADAADGRRHVMVCEGMKDAWLVWQNIQGTPLASTLIITSTHGTAPPKEWRDPAFWTRFETVYLAFDSDDAGNDYARRVAELVTAAGRTAHRLMVPADLEVSTKDGTPGKDWTDFFLSGRTAADLAALMSTVRPVLEENVVQADEGGRTTKLGLVAARAVDVSMDLVDGVMYYPLRLSSREIVKDEVRERWLTVVVGSDRSIQHPKVSPAPAGTPTRDLMYRLHPSGILIGAPPEPNPHSSWDYEHALRWIDKQVTVRSLGEIVADLERILYDSFWLPNSEDYTLLALSALVSYALPCFESVPLFLVNGPPETGKTTIGRTMEGLAFNGTTIGVGSAAAITRHINRTKGFVVLDDLEGVGAASTQGAGNAEFKALVNALKLSYARTSAKKSVINTKNGMEEETLNFFGVKMVNNTMGVEDILGTRMFRIYTQAIPPGVAKERALKAPDPAETTALRHEIHAWVFDNLATIITTLAKLYPHRSDRSNEIAAPLRAFADMAGDEGVKARLDIAITRQRNTKQDDMNADQVLADAVESLVLQGYRKIAPQLVSNEMGVIYGGLDWGKNSQGEIPEWQRPHWVGGKLRAGRFIEEGVREDKKRLPSWDHWIRTYPIAQRVLDKMREEYPDLDKVPLKRPESFCAACPTCSYAATCVLQKTRALKEQAQNEATRAAGRVLKLKTGT